MNLLKVILFVTCAVAVSHTASFQETRLNFDTTDDELAQSRTVATLLNLAGKNAGKFLAAALGIFFGPLASAIAQPLLSASIHKWTGGALSRTVKGQLKPLTGPSIVLTDGRGKRYLVTRMAGEEVDEEDYEDFEPEYSYGVDY